MSASRCPAKPNSVGRKVKTSFTTRKSLQFFFFLPPFAPSFENKTAATAAALLARCTLTSCLSASSSCGPFYDSCPVFFTQRKPSADGIQPIEAASVRFPTWYLSDSSCQAKVGPSLDQTRSRRDRTRSVATPCLHMLTCCARSAAVQKLWRGRGEGWGVKV